MAVSTRGNYRNEILHIRGLESYRFMSNFKCSEIDFSFIDDIGVVDSLLTTYYLSKIMNIDALWNVVDLSLEFKTIVDTLRNAFDKEAPFKGLKSALVAGN